MKIKKISTIVIIRHFLLLAGIILVLQVSVAASPLVIPNDVQVPIVMYHNIAKNKSLLGKWTITPEEFEEDLLYIKENGYETIVMKDLIEFVNKGKALPAKPIVITFDDGHYNVYRYALPLLEKYNMKSVVSIIGKVTDEYSDIKPKDSGNFPHLTWEQINEMLESGLVELQNHSYNLHHSIGAKKERGESELKYRDRLSKDLIKLQDRIQEMTGKQSDTFVYPFGAISEQSDAVLQEIGFSASLSCYDKMNTITAGKPETLFGLGRTLRPHGYQSAKIFGKFSNIAQN